MSQRTQSAQPVNRVFPGRKPDLPRYIREMEADYHQIHRLMQHRIEALEADKRLRALEDMMRLTQEFGLL